jgi:hypothetical protein
VRSRAHADVRAPQTEGALGSARYVLESVVGHVRILLGRVHVEDIGPAYRRRPRAAERSHRFWFVDDQQIEAFFDTNPH